MYISGSGCIKDSAKKLKLFFRNLSVTYPINKEMKGDLESSRDPPCKESRRSSFDEKVFDIETQKLEIERQRLSVERERLQIERERLGIEQQKFVMEQQRHIVYLAQRGVCFDH